MTSTPFLESDDLLPRGTLIDGRYEILRPLGRGGFAVVYEALHRTLDRRAALKILDLHGNSQELARYRERFAHEAKLAARLEHPNVVRIFDHGFVSQSGQPYIAMEALSGHDLEHELVHHGPLELGRALRLFDGVLDALGDAHQKGIVHKDLKPSNLFVCDPGTERERLVILDYGIARLYETPESRLTQTHQYTGTPAYAAPEYIADQTVSPALDVYQAGLILAEALSGEPVIQASSPMACFVAHCNGLGKLDPRLDGSPLGALIRRALSVDPSKRFASGAQMREALARIDHAQHATLLGAPLSQDNTLATAETLATPPVITHPPAPPRSSNLGGMLGVGCALLAVLGLIGGVLAPIAFGAFFYLQATPEPPPMPSGGEPAPLATGNTASPVTALAGEPDALQTTSQPAYALIQHPIATTHRNILTHVLLSEPQVRTYLFTLGHEEELSQLAASASLDVGQQPFQYFRTSLESMLSTYKPESSQGHQLKSSVSAYLEVFDDFAPVARELDIYWRVERTWMQDGGRGMGPLNLKLRAKWAALVAAREVVFERLIALNAVEIDRQLEATSSQRQPLQLKVLRALHTLQTVQSQITASPHSSKTRAAHQDLEQQLSMLRDRDASRRLEPHQQQLVTKLSEYMIASREYLEESDERRTKKSALPGQRELMDEVGVYGFTSEFVGIMELFYRD